MRMKLLCISFLHVASFSAGTGEHKTCGSSQCKYIQDWKDDVSVEEQGVKLLQVKGSKLSVEQGMTYSGQKWIMHKSGHNRDAEEWPAVPHSESEVSCPVLEQANLLPYGKGCPLSGGINGVLGTTCLNGNIEYSRLTEAWAACTHITECEFILSTSSGKFFLRRGSDPDLPLGDASKSYVFQCSSRDAFFKWKNAEYKRKADQEKERLEKDTLAKCPLLESPNIMPFGKACPRPLDGQHGFQKPTCLNGETPYASRRDAWIACAQVDECGAIMQTANGTFFLRRTTDPNMPLGDNSRTIEFHCPTQMHERLQARRDREVRKRQEAQKLMEEALDKCPLPAQRQIVPGGKGCPAAGVHEGVLGGSCLNGNTPYWTLAEAWTACAEVAGCSAIFYNPDESKFFLRRASDPDMPEGAKNAYTVVFQCEALEGRTLKEVEKDDEIQELKTKLAEEEEELAKVKRELEEEDAELREIKAKQLPQEAPKQKPRGAKPS